MNKGLEALEEIKSKPFSWERLKDTLDIIEKELKELEERREMMRRFNEACVPMVLDNETEKKLQALEIIRKEIGCTTIIYNFGYLLSEEQKDLLKEVLI